MWSIDRIEPPYALCEENRTGERKNIPLAELPQNVREGDLLRLSPQGWKVQRMEAERRRRELSLRIKNLFRPE